MSRTGGNNRYFRSTRWPVPVEENLTRMVYLNVERYEKRPGFFRRLVSGATWPYRNWELNFNFRNQDYDAEKYTQYDMPEYLSSTDSVVVAMRRLFADHNRDVIRPAGAGGGPSGSHGRERSRTHGARRRHQGSGFHRSIRC